MTKEEARNNLVQYLPQDKPENLTQTDAQKPIEGLKVNEMLFYKDMVDREPRGHVSDTCSPSERNELIKNFLSTLPQNETPLSEEMSGSDYLGSLVEEAEVVPMVVEKPPLPSTPAPSIPFTPSESDISEMSEFFESSPSRAYGASPPRLLVWTRPLEDEDVQQTENETAKRSYIYQPPPMVREVATPLAVATRRRRTNVPPPTATKPPTPAWLQKLVKRQQKVDAENWEELEKLRTELRCLQEGKDETDAANSKHAKEKAQLEFENKEQELRNMRSEVTTLNFELANKDSELTSLEVEIEYFKKQLKAGDKNKEVISKLRDDLDKSLKEVEKKNQELNTINSHGVLYKLQLEKREKEFSSKEKELERKEAELTALRLEIDSVEIEKSEAMTDADSKYFELLGQYEVLKKQLQEKIEENERLLRELIEAQDTIASLQKQIAELERRHSDRDALQSKMKAAEAALKRKAGEEKRLYQELASAQHKLASYNDMNRTRGSLQRDYSDIKKKFDVLEHRRREAELAVVPLKAKVSRLIKKCRERDDLVGRLVAELRLVCPGDSSGGQGQLLKQALQLQAEMASEEHNQPVEPACYSPFPPHSPIDQTLQNMSHNALLEESRRERSTLSQWLSPERVEQLSQPLWQAVERAAPGILANGSPLDTVDDLLRQHSDSSPPLNNLAMQEQLQTSQKDALIDSMLKGRTDSQSWEMSPITTSRGLSPTTPSLTTPMGDTSPEEILHMHEELRDFHINNYIVRPSLSPRDQHPEMGRAQQLFSNGLQQQQQQLAVAGGSSYSYHSSQPAHSHYSLTSPPLLGHHHTNGDQPDGMGRGLGQGQALIDSNTSSSRQSLLLGQQSRMPKPEGCPDPVASFVILRVIGSHSVLFNWSPPPMDQMGRNQGLQVAGYKIHANGKLKQHVASAHLTKALVDGLNLSRPVKFSIQTVSVTGQTSHPVSIEFTHTVSSSSSLRSESLASESATESEFSSSLPSEYQEIPRTQKRTFMAVYDYDPRKHSPNDYLAYELTFKEGELITIYGNARPDGFYFGRIGKKKGLIPSNFIEEVPANHKKVENRQEKIRSSQYSTSDYHNSPSENNTLSPFKNIKKTLSSSQI